MDLFALNKFCAEQNDDKKKHRINIASRYGHVDIVSMLLEEGVDLHWELKMVRTQRRCIEPAAPVILL